MSSDVPEIVKSLNHFSLFIVCRIKKILFFSRSFAFRFSFIFPAITRKRYVKEKLFNQMLNELCARQCEKEDGVIGKNTEYSNQFGRSNDDDRQVRGVYVSLNM